MISIFTNTPAITFENIQGDQQPSVGYHFDAILRYSVDQRAMFTSYPIEFGADLQDHAYNEPDKMLIYGVTGSREMRFSINQLPEIGAEALIGNINNPVLSAVAGVLVDAGYLGGNTETRAGATLQFLTDLKQKFTTFTVVTDLLKIPNVKIDRIINDVNTENETGLEFIVELSQLRMPGAESNNEGVVPNLPDGDPAKTQAASLVDRGLVSLG